MYWKIKLKERENNIHSFNYIKIHKDKYFNSLNLLNKLKQWDCQENLPAMHQV